MKGHSVWNNFPSVTSRCSEASDETLTAADHLGIPGSGRQRQPSRKDARMTPRQRRPGGDEATVENHFGVRLKPLPHRSVITQIALVLDRTRPGHGLTFRETKGC